MFEQVITLSKKSAMSRSPPSPPAPPPPLPPPPLIPPIPQLQPQPEPLFPRIRPDSPHILNRSPFGSPALSAELPFYPFCSIENISKHMLSLSIIAEHNFLLQYIHINELIDLVKGCNYMYKHFQLIAETENLEAALKDYESIKEIDKRLNDDCIMEIIKWLDITGLIYVAIHNSRLRELAKYGRKHLSLTLNLQNKNAELCRLMYLLSPLEFGRTIEELHITFIDSESYCCAREIVTIIELLASLIGRQLRKLLINVRSMHQSDLEFIIQNIEEIQTFSFHIISR